jgi:hypothetical protein
MPWRLDHSAFPRQRGSSASASRWARDMSSAVCPAASTPQSRRFSSMRRSATSSPASSWIMACSAKASEGGRRSLPRPLQHPARRR